MNRVVGPREREAVRLMFVRASFVYTLRQIQALPMTLDCPDVEK